MSNNPYGNAPIPSNKVNRDIYGNPINQQYFSMGQPQPQMNQPLMNQPLINQPIMKPQMNQPQMNQPQMNQPQKFQEFQNQFDEVKKKFSNFQECPPISEQNQLVFQVTISVSKFNFPINIIIDENFPNSAPIFKPSQKITHFIIDPKTQIIQYQNELRWVPMQSKIVQILDYITNKFVQCQPQLDPLMESYNKLIDQCNFNSQLEEFNKTDFMQIYQTDNYQELAPHAHDQSNQLQASLASTSEFKDLAQKFVKLIEFNNEAQDKTNKLLEEYQKKGEKLNKANQIFEEKKQAFLIKFNQYQMVTERFNKEKILQVLEGQLNRVDEESAKEMELRSSQGFMDAESMVLDQKEGLKKFQKKLQDFYELRKMYHLQTIKKEKLVEQM